jgi:hypothetical protein
LAVRVPDDFGGIFAEVFGVPMPEPAVIAAVTPVGEVFVIHGNARKLGGEDFFDPGKVIQPGNGLATALAIEKAQVELLAKLLGETGDFAEEGALGAVVVRIACFVKNGLNPGISRQVIHAGILTVLLKRS